MSGSDKQDFDLILARRADNGGDYWATPDGRWGVGAPFSTYECGLMLCELGLANNSPIAKGIADTLLACREPDGRIRPGPKLPVQPCHTADAARLLCRLGLSSDPRLKKTFEWLRDNQHTDGGWRCRRVRLGASPETDASNPGVTLSVLDAFRFEEGCGARGMLDAAVDSLLDHWFVRRPLGPCGYGIGSRFMKVEYPFIRYNLFFYVYTLSFYQRARSSRAFREALDVLQTKLSDGAVVIEHVRPGLEALQFCRENTASVLATARYREILQNLAG